MSEKPESTLLCVRLSRGRTAYVEPALVKECRDWAMDCSWKEDPEEIKEMSDEEVVASVDRYYEGGLGEVAANCFLDPPVIEHG